ncbi:MAG: AAA family ATPase [Pararhodobacter sp.]|nr:AAA family ATPase [Pararhodobacter sp.]
MNHDRPFFETDEFAQNAPLFAHTLANALRARSRYPHLVRPLVMALKSAGDEAGHCELVPVAAPLLARHDRKSGKSGLTRTGATEALIERLDALGQARNLAPRAAMLQANLGHLAAILGLDEIEVEILRCQMTCDSNRAYSRLVDRIHHEVADLHETLACVLATEPDEIRRRLSPAGRLLRSGLIRLAREGRNFSDCIESHGRLSTLEFEAFADATALKTRLLGQPARTDLQPDDFAHLADDLRLIADILRGAFANRERGVNILLYGIPGTGKTEFAKVLANVVSAAMYPIGEVDDEGGEPTRNERLSELALMQMLLGSEAAPAFCCFDEAEDLFGSFGFGFSRVSGSKIFVNRLFETNTVPVIWIVNDIEALPATVRRRMTLALKIDQPPRDVSARILGRMAGAMDLALPPERLKALVRDLPASPGLYAKAIQATVLAGGDPETLAHVSSGLVQALNDGALPRNPRRIGAGDFRPELSNADTDLVDLAARLEACEGRAFSLCLFGASGTGKSAFARHVAERLGMEVRALRGSDLLGMFVGQTEAAIADAFRRAEQDGAFLILDEVDALLHDRGMAQRSFELSQVNELLQAMESHKLPFACTTNLFGKLDNAALRRFTFRVRFQPLEHAQLNACYRHFLGRAAPGAVGALSGLAPADFELVRRQADILGVADDDDAIIGMLEAELAMKPGAPREIGFRPPRPAARQAPGLIAATRSRA